MRYVVKWMKENLLSEREEMFGEGDGVYVLDFLIFYTSCVMDDNKVQRLILTIFLGGQVFWS